MEHEVIPKERRIAGLERNVFFLGLVSFFTDTSSEMIRPLLPIFLSSVLGVNKAFIGLIEGIAESTASILKLFSGWISDRIGRRKALVLVGYSFSAVSKPFFAAATSGWHVLLVRFADRVGKGIRTSPRDAIIADSTSEEERGRSFGFHRSLDSAGAIAGPLLAFIILPALKNNLRLVFLASFVPALLAVLIIIFFVRERRPPGGGIPRSLALSLRSMPGSFKVFIAIAVIFTLGNSSDAFLILRAQDVGVTTKLIPILWLVFNAVYSFSAAPSGVLSDRIGRRRIIIYGLLIYSLTYFGFAFAGAPLHIWGLFAIYGIYYGFADGAFRAYVADLVPSELRATAYGVYHTAVGITAFPASVVMGILWQAVGATAAFSFGAILALAAAFSMALFLKK